MPETWEGSDDRKRTAWHEAGHALLRQLLIPEQSIDLVTIIPHESGALGFVAWNPDAETYSHSKKELMDELAVLLAGREAERMTPDLDNSERGVNSGASSDLKQATRMTFAAITQYGLDEEFGEVCLSGLPESMRGSLSTKIHERVKTWLSEAKETARKALEDNKVALKTLAEELENKDSMNGERVKEIVDQFMKATSEQESGNGRPHAVGEESIPSAGSRTKPIASN